MLLLFLEVASFTSPEPTGEKSWEVQLIKLHGQEKEVENLLGSCESLALNPPEDVIMRFDQVCSASESFPEINIFLKFFQQSWLEIPGRLCKQRN